MKGIEIGRRAAGAFFGFLGSDHCPAMKGIEIQRLNQGALIDSLEATTAPQ